MYQKIYFRNYLKFIIPYLKSLSSKYLLFLMYKKQMYFKDTWIITNKTKIETFENNLTNERSEI